MSILGNPTPEHVRHRGRRSVVPAQGSKVEDRLHRRQKRVVRVLDVGDVARLREGGEGLRTITRDYPFHAVSALHQRVLRQATRRALAGEVLYWDFWCLFVILLPFSCTDRREEVALCSRFVGGADPLPWYGYYQGDPGGVSPHWTFTSTYFRSLAE